MSLIDLSVINPVHYSSESIGFVLKFYQSKYLEKLIIRHINIDFIRNKFKILKSMLAEVLHTLMITETKRYDSFPKQQFHTQVLIYRSG